MSDDRNNNTKIIIWVIVIVVILGAIWFYYYYNKKSPIDMDNSSQIVEPIEDNTSTSSYFKELASFLPTDLTGEATYYGSLEHSHTINFNNAKSTNSSVDYTGKIIADEEATNEILDFTERYFIVEDTLKLIQLNKNRLFFQSIVKDKSLLQGPIQVGNTWSQQVDIGSKEYTAKYEIMSIDKNSAGKEMIIVDMIIEGLKGYANDTLKETTTITQGKGVTEFQTVILTGKKDEDKIPIQFKYNLYTNNM